MPQNYSMEDLLSELMGQEENPMGSNNDYYSTGMDNISEDFLESPIDKVRKANQIRTQQLAAENNRRIADYEKELKRTPKERSKEIYEKDFKSIYGFTPDKGAKKVAGTLIDTIMGILPIVGPAIGNQKLRSYAKGDNEYSQVTDAYKALLSSVNAGDRVENTLYKNNMDLALSEEANNLKKQQTQAKFGLDKDKFNQKKELDNRVQSFKESMGQRGIELKEDQLTAMKALWESQAAKNDAMSENIILKTDGEKRLNEIAEKYGVPPGWLKNNSPEGLAIMLANPETAKEMNGKQILDNLDFIKRGSGSGQGETIRTTPIYKPGVGGSSTFDRMEVTRIPKAGTVRKNPLGNPLEGLNPIAQQAVTPKPSLAQNLAQSITKPGAIKPINPAESLEKQLEAITTNPARIGDIRSTASGTVKAVDNMRKWESLKDRSSMLYQSAAGDYAADKLKNWKTAIRQMSPIEAMRTITGKSTSEINDDIQHTFLGLEHLRQRSGGRVGEQMYNKFKETLSSKLDNPEGYLRRLGVQSMMIEFGHLQENDPRFQTLVDDYTRAYEKNPKAGATLAEVINETIENSIKLTKKNKVVEIPNVQKALRLGLKKLRGETIEDDSDAKSDLLKFLK